ncbi:MAG: hypothetical protein HJJLKODD_02795 [Phycisphaerae bacterium]|nr:hypothetical protein [Phycisphaerae bacterium]
MGPAAREFQHDSFQDRETIVHYLSALGEAFRQGQLVLSSQGEDFLIDAPGLMRFTVRARQRGDRAQMVLKFSWKNRIKNDDFRVGPISPRREDESR